MKLPKFFYFLVKSEEKGTKIVLENASDRDVVEVIRCRECKHLRVRSVAFGVYQCAIHGDYPSGEYFCADGERKDGGQDDV